MEDGSTEEAFNVAVSAAERIICLAGFGGMSVSNCSKINYHQETLQEKLIN